MTFNDIFKSSFLESVTEFSVLDVLIGMAFALVIGLFIFVFRHTACRYSMKAVRQPDAPAAQLLYASTAPVRQSLSNRTAAGRWLSGREWGTGLLLETSLVLGTGQR